ncbi:MAG: flagellar hook-associated protein FlgK [Planctomycetota bacterium]|jgi:flagellar hook-associated protein FlgK
MAGFSIGINALRTAAQLIDIAGDNVANANTPGYHAKRADVHALEGPTRRTVRIGLGATVDDVTRIRNALIERSLLTHVQLMERLGQEVELLGQMEMLFTEPSSGGLDALLGNFFDSIARLAADPDDLTLREAVVQSAQSVSNMFNRLGRGLSDLADTLITDAEYVVGQVNGLTEQIAYLNSQIRLHEASGTSAPTLKDNRDQLIRELAELVNVTVYELDYGVVSVSCAGTLLVSGNESNPLQLINEDGQLTVARSGAVGHRVPVREGKLAGLLELSNNLLPQYRSSLDELANVLRRAVNLVHSTALGLEGRFHSLEGSTAILTDDPFFDLGYGVSAGTSERLVFNVEDESTGEVTQFELVLDTTQAADAFLTGLRDDINAGVDHVTATISEGRLQLAAEDGYAFGFATPYDPNPAAPGDITAVDPTSPTILDAYSGQEDLLYEFSFLDGGEIGTDPITIQIQVRQPAGPVLRTITRQIDDTYDAGSAITLENGLSFTLSAGNVAAGDGFSFTARASMDTAGVLDALGLNVLFEGLGAGLIQVADRVYNDPAQLAGALREVPGDNHRLLDMAQIASETLAGSGTTTLNEEYRALVGGIATARNAKRVAHANQQELVKELENRRDSISGVSVDEEMIHIIESRTIYQGALKYIQTIDGLLEDLISIL